MKLLKGTEETNELQKWKQNTFEHGNELNWGDEYLTEIITHELARNEVQKVKLRQVFRGTLYRTWSALYYFFPNRDVDFDSEKDRNYRFEVWRKIINTMHSIIKSFWKYVITWLNYVRLMNRIPVRKSRIKTPSYTSDRADEMAANDELVTVPIQILVWLTHKAPLGVVIAREMSELS